MVTEANGSLVDNGSAVEDIIVARDVHKWFGNFHALRGVDMTVKRGEKIVILGPSGSGKSTFIRCINRLEEHQRGEIVVDGIAMTNDLHNIDAIRSEVGMVFQSFNLFPHLSVMQNITLAPIKVRKMPQSEAEEVATQLLERVGIPEQAEKYPWSSPAVSSSAWPSPAPSPCVPESCCSTNQPPPSTRR